MHQEAKNIDFKEVAFPSSRHFLQDDLSHYSPPVTIKDRALLWKIIWLDYFHSFLSFMRPMWSIYADFMAWSGQTATPQKWFMPFDQKWPEYLSKSLEMIRKFSSVLSVENEDGACRSQVSLLTPMNINCVFVCFSSLLGKYHKDILGRKLDFSRTPVTQ